MGSLDTIRSVCFGVLDSGADMPWNVTASAQNARCDMIKGDIKSVVIIGAGISGLATAKCLKEKGIICTIYDRNTKLGGVWADGYHGFGVQIQKYLYEFPDFPLPE